MYAHLTVRKVKWNHLEKKAAGFSSPDSRRKKFLPMLNPVTYVIINLGIIAILWSGGNQVYLGRLTQGQVIALINYMSQILVELIKLANLIILLSKAIASLNRVNNIFDMQPSIKRRRSFPGI